MPNHVCNNAALKCTMGLSPGLLGVLPVNRVMTSSQPAANIMDHVPLVNIRPFGVCISPTNPVVAAATAAAFGVLTPMPCVPATPTPWVPGSPTVMLGNLPALNKSSTLMCQWGGLIEIEIEGQATHQIP